MIRRILTSIAVLVILTCMGVLLLQAEANAADYMSFMAGFGKSGEHSLSETKFLNVGHRETILSGLVYQYEVGVWADNAGNGRKSSGYAATQFGLEANSSLCARIMIGPAVITTPDTYLGGNFPLFTEDFFFGVHDQNGNNVGAKYKHISSAGVVMPNIGRDFMGLEASIHF